jgi:hypothetical protein
MRYSLIVLAAALATTFGCQQRQAPEPAQTEITSAEMPRSQPQSNALREPTTLEELRANARRDLINLDQRIRYVESRSTRPNAPPQARVQIIEARAQRDVLVRALDDLDPATWQTQRDALDRQWESASSMTDSASSMVTDEAR